jgi:putative transcriptional regulator
MASSSRIFERPQEPGFLDGQFLVAMPGMEDPRFKRAVIYVCAHSAAGAMGIIVNHPAPHVSFPDLLVQLKILPEGSDILLPPGAGDVPVVQGGPVEQARGFLLHSPEVFIDNSTLPLADGLCLTATLDILKAIARGNGPRSAVLALGYAGWAPGQLETEIQHNGWLSCPADPAIVLDADLPSKYLRVMRRIGIDPALLSSEAGRA